MKGLLLPCLFVQESDHFPSIGTVNRARNGATPRIMDIWVSENPALRRSGGMKVKATQAAISRPPTTALMAIRRLIDSFFDILILINWFFWLKCWSKLSYLFICICKSLWVNFQKNKIRYDFLCHCSSFSNYHRFHNSHLSSQFTKKSIIMFFTIIQHFILVKVGIIKYKI